MIIQLSAHNTSVPYIMSFKQLLLNRPNLIEINIKLNTNLIKEFYIKFLDYTD